MSKRVRRCSLQGLRDCGDACHGAVVVGQVVILNVEARQCSYECFVVFMKIEGLKYEVYTAKEHYSRDRAGNSRSRSAVGIIDGLGTFDPIIVYASEDAWGRADTTQDKALREGYFPMGLAKQAFQLTL